MPAQPIWYSRIDSICRELETIDRPHVSRADIEKLMVVSRRQAQRIMAPVVADRVGTNGLVDRAAFIRHIRNLARGDAGSFEVRRRQKVAAAIGQLVDERRREPKLLVEAPALVVNQELEDLPDGVNLAPGLIQVNFSNPTEALEKLLKLAMAIQNDFSGFAELVTLKARGAAG